MVRGWFDASEAQSFAREIARDINTLFPADRAGRKPISARKNAKKLDGLIRRTRTFAQQHKLNVYKRAKLLNTVKWQLREAGHEDALIDEVVALLAPQLT